MAARTKCRISNSAGARAARTKWCSARWRSRWRARRARCCTVRRITSPSACSRSSKRSTRWSRRARPRSAKTCSSIFCRDFASGALSLGERGGHIKWLQKALDARQRYLDKVDRTTDPGAWGAAQQEIGRALTSLGEREGARDKLEEGAARLRLAMDALRSTDSLQQAEVALRALQRAEQTLQQRRRVGLRWPATDQALLVSVELSRGRACASSAKRYGLIRIGASCIVRVTAPCQRLLRIARGVAARAAPGISARACGNQLPAIDAARHDDVGEQADPAARRLAAWPAPRGRCPRRSTR